jgi:hypothetical protein
MGVLILPVFEGEADSVSLLLLMMESMLKLLDLPPPPPPGCAALRGGEAMWGLWKGELDVGRMGLKEIKNMEMVRMMVHSR